MADSEKYFTKVVDGQLSVATVSQSGEIIPEESRPGDVYTTALVNTDNGPQLCVKTFDLNGGGGGGVTVDQTYDATSTNAQSGTAVAEALEPALENKSTSTSSLIVSPSLSATKNSNYATVIQNEDFSYTPGTGSTSIGYYAGSSNSYTTCVGYSAQASSEKCTSIGCNSSSTGRTSLSCGATALGAFASATWGTAVGSCTHTGTSSLAVGRGFDSSHMVEATAFKSIAIGIIPSNENVDKVEANANEAIQIGTGVNATAKTLQVFTFQLLDGNTGYIPADRLGTGFDATKTQVLKNVNGTLTWVDE